LGSIDDATACPGTATYQASVSASGAVDQTPPGANQSTLTLIPSAQIISTAFPHPDTTVGQTSPLGVQVKHSAGLALGSPITVRAQLTSQTDPGIVVTPTLADQTLSTQTTSAGTLSFSFNTTVGGDSTGGTVVFSAFFPFNPLEGFGGLTSPDLTDPCNINTAYIQSLYFTPDSVAAGQTTPTTLIVQVKYWSSQNGNLPVSLSPDSIPGCASVVRITPDYALPIGPTGPGGSILTYSFAMTVSNGCTVESLLRYRASLQPATGVTGSFLPGVTFGSRIADLTLQAPPPPTVQIVSPTNGADFDLYDFGGTAAVDIDHQANANVNTLVHWTEKFSYRTSGGRCSSCDVTETFNTSPGAHLLRTCFSQGGRVSVNASITVSGQTINAQPVTVTVTGHALSDDQITNRLVGLYSGGATPRLLTGLAMVESTYRQFKTTTLYGREDLWPLESFDGGSHIGLMQVVTTMARAFDWYINTEDGANIFIGGLQVSANHEMQDRNAHPTLPPLTPTQHEDNSLGYYRLGTARSNRYWIPSANFTSWVVNTANTTVVNYVMMVRNSMR
jgi:hypothetical protein